tara:strand:+ start:350 stop:1081 length:732 start_codon:yes stop_codon:yes gene_type:complete
MTSVVTAPLGCKENPYPFIKGQKDRIVGKWYYGRKGDKKKCCMSGGKLKLRPDRHKKYPPKILPNINKPLGSKENPRPFIYGESRIDGDYYTNMNGDVIKCVNGRLQKKVKKETQKKRMANEKFKRETILEKRLLKILSAAKASTKKRAKKGRNYNFDIDLEYLLDLWEECNGECFRFKIKMSLLDGDVWLVSLDRIDPSKGYIKGNVQLVSWQYNLMKGNRTEEEMDKVFDQLRLVYSNTSL